MHAELHWRTKTQDQTLATADGAAGKGAHPGDISMTMTAPAVSAACGDVLSLQLQLTRATGYYLEFLVTLRTPK